MAAADPSRPALDFGGEAGHALLEDAPGVLRVEGPYHSGVRLSAGVVRDATAVRGLSITGEPGTRTPLAAGARARPGESAAQEPTARGSGGRAWLTRLTPLGRVELEAGPDGWPESIRLRYSIDGGRHWLRLPRAELHNLRNVPGHVRLSFDLHGVVADALGVFDPADAPASVGLAAFAADKPAWAEAPDAPGVAAALTGMWLQYGPALTEVKLSGTGWQPNPPPLEGGMVGLDSAEWADINTRKLSVSPDPDLRRRVEDMLVKQRSGEDGYVWASPDFEKHLEHSRHYTTNAQYAEGVARHFLWNRDPAFLDRKNPQGRSVLDRGRAALDQLLGDFGGEAGLVRIDDPANDGTPSGLPNNYWDVWRFGGVDGLLNAQAYEAVLGWAELEKAIGERAREMRLREVAQKMEASMPEALWNPDTGRFVGAINVEGEKHDYGFPFVNLAVLAAGLGDDAQATSVFDWLDGRRLVAGDTSKGADIYHWGLAPRSNTLSAESRGGVSFEDWGGSLGVNNDGPGSWGRNSQNGGAIFCVSSDDLLARLRWLGPDAALERLGGIAAAFAEDGLRRMPVTRFGHNTVLGVQGPFPESGLVPLFALEGFLGVEPVSGGLRVTPRLPSGWDSFRVSGVCFAGETFDIEAVRAGVAKIETDADGRRVVTVPVDAAALLAPDHTLQTLPEPTP